MKKITLLLLPALILLLAACSGRLPDNTVDKPADLAGKTVGVLENSVTEGYLRDVADKVYIRTFSEKSSLAAELKSGALDAVIADETLSADLTRDSSLRALDTPFINRAYCIAISEENATLLKNVNDALKTLRRGGTLDKLADWDEETFSFEDEGETAGTLVIAVAPDFAPYAYYDENGALAGLEIDLARLLCRQLGLTPEFRVAERDKLLYLAESGKVSLAIGRITRGENAVSYSDTYLTSVQSIVVRKD